MPEVFVGLAECEARGLAEVTDIGARREIGKIGQSPPHGKRATAIAGRKPPPCCRARDQRDASLAIRNNAGGWMSPPVLQECGWECQCTRKSLVVLTVFMPGGAGAISLLARVIAPGERSESRPSARDGAVHRQEPAT